MHEQYTSLNSNNDNILRLSKGGDEGRGAIMIYPNLRAYKIDALSFGYMQQVVYFKTENVIW